jgi:hypothetical protein
MTERVLIVLVVERRQICVDNAIFKSEMMDASIAVSKIGEWTVIEDH